MSEERTTRERRGRPWLAGLLGFVLGLVVMAFVMVVAVQRLMIVERPSRLGLDETVAAIEERLKAEGWASPGTLDLNQSMARHGVDLRPRVRLVQLCKAPYAKQVLAADRRMACLMPCTIAVYEGHDGKVHVSKVNTGLLGKLFGGTVARVMGGKVGPEEKKILADVIQH